jgi:thioesterase domain-containing protein
MLIFPSGGVIAFEMGKVLEQKSQQVGFLGLLNIPPHISWRMQQLGWIEIAANLCLFLDFVSANDLEDLIHEAKDVAQRLGAEDVEVESATGQQQKMMASWLLDKAPPARLADLSLTPASFTQWINVALDLSKMARNYSPIGQVSSPVTVFVAIPLAGLGTKTEWKEKHLEPWHNHVKGTDTLRFVDVQGSHYTMLNDDNVDSFYRSFAAELHRLSL